MAEYMFKLPSGEIVRIEAPTQEAAQKGMQNVMAQRNAQEAPQTPQDAFTAPTLPTPPVGGEDPVAPPEALAGGVSQGLQGVMPLAIADQAPPGTDPAQWAALPFDQRIAIKSEETIARQDRMAELLPEFMPKVNEDDQMQYGEALPMHKGDHVSTRGLDPATREVLERGRAANPENQLRKRGIETRKSAEEISGVTVALLNVVPPPVLTDPNDEEQINEFKDWRGKMRVALARSLKNDFGLGDDADIAVRFDNDSGEWVYLNPNTGGWNTVVTHGMNTEDFNAMFQDPAQAGIVVGEILASVGLGLATGGIGLVVGEGAIGAVGAAASQALRNRRAQEGGFQRDTTEGIGTAAALGGAGGLVGGGIAAKTARPATRNAVKKIVEDELPEAASRDVLKDVDQMVDDIIEAERVGIPRADQKAALAEQADRQAKLDEGLESLDKIGRRPVDAQGEAPTARATTGPRLSGSQAAEQDFAGKLRQKVEMFTEQLTRRGPNGELIATTTPALRIRRALDRALHTSTKSQADKVATEMWKREKVVTGSGHVYASRKLKEVTGFNPQTKVNEIEIDMNLPMRREVVQVRRAIRELADEATPESRDLIEGISDALGGLTGRTRQGDELILNGAQAERSIEQLDRLLYDDAVSLNDGALRNQLTSFRNKLVDNYVRTANKFSDGAGDAVARWSRTSADRAKANSTRHPVDIGAAQQDYFDAGGTLEELVEAGVAQTGSGDKLSATLKQATELTQRLSDPVDGITNQQLVDAILRPSSQQTLSAADSRILEKSLQEIASVRRKVSKSIESGTTPSQLDLKVSSHIKQMQSAVKDEIQTIINTAMKGSPQRASEEISSLLRPTNRRRLELLMGPEYAADLQQVRTMIRRFTLETRMPKPKLVEEAVRNWTKTLLVKAPTSAIGLGSAMLFAGASLPITLSGLGGVALAQFMRSGRRTTNVRATEAVSQMLSQPHLLKALNTLKTTRTITAGLGVELNKIAALMESNTDDPVTAFITPQGEIVPLRKPNGEPYKDGDKPFDLTEEIKKANEKRKELRGNVVDLLGIDG